MEDPEIEPQDSPATQDTPEPEPEAAPETAHALPQTISIEEWMASNDADAEEAPPQTALEDVQLLAVLEACVYVAEEPLMPAQIAAALNQDPERVKALLQQLMAEFERPEHGVSIKEVAGGYKMATKPEHHEAVRNFVKSLKAPLKLSLPALETLAVVAYKQPVTSPEIMEIRGVQGGGVLKTLLDRRLITEAGRKNVIGKPILYKTTKEFLIQFGLKDLSELPTLKEFEEIRRMAMADSEVPAEAPLAEAGALKAAPQAVAEAAVPEIEAASEEASAPKTELVDTESATGETAPAEVSAEPEAATSDVHAATDDAIEETAAAEASTPGAHAATEAAAEETPAAIDSADPEATTTGAHASIEAMIEETGVAEASAPETELVVTETPTEEAPAAAAPETQAAVKEIPAGTPAPRAEATAREPASSESQDH